MNAPDQLTMFEPTGSELATLARTYLASAETLKRQADNLAKRMYIFSARSYDHQAKEALSKAEVFETAYQLEQLAGLS